MLFIVSQSGIFSVFVPITDNGEASFDFYTSDSDTPYTILVQGVSEDGRIHTVEIYVGMDADTAPLVGTIVFGDSSNKEITGPS